MRVLALVPGSISDQILFFPTLGDIREAYPAAQIDVVVEPRAKPAYRVSTVVNDVFLFDFQINSSPSDWANLLGIVRDREYEAVLTLTKKWSLGLLLWLSGVPTRIGYAGTSGAVFFTHKVPAKQAQYQAYLYHDLLQGLGIPLPCSPPTLNVPQRDLDWASQQRENLGLKDTGYVLISDDLSLGGGYPAEQWQTVLADFQAKQPGLPLVCLQERSNVALVQALAKTLPGLKICTATNVGQTAAMVAGADLVLCTPSSVMQMAIALNVFTLALFDTQAAVNRQLPPLAKGEETRFVGIASDTGTLVDIPADRILQKVWGG